MAKGSQHVSSFPSFLLPAQFVSLVLLCQAFAEPAQCNNSARTLCSLLGYFPEKLMIPASRLTTGSRRAGAGTREHVAGSEVTGRFRLSNPTWPLLASWS